MTKKDDIFDKVTLSLKDNTKDEKTTQISLPTSINNVLNQKARDAHVTKSTYLRMLIIELFKEKNLVSTTTTD